MTEDELRNAVLEALTEVAPDLDPAAIDHGRSLRDQVDIDSVDYLNFVLTLEKKLGVRIPETEYPRLSSVDGAVAFLESCETA